MSRSGTANGASNRRTVHRRSNLGEVNEADQNLCGRVRHVGPAGRPRAGARHPIRPADPRRREGQNPMQGGTGSGDEEFNAQPGAARTGRRGPARRARSVRAAAAAAKSTGGPATPPRRQALLGARLPSTLAFRTELRPRCGRSFLCLQLMPSEQREFNRRSARRRVALMLLRRFLPSSRRCFEPKVGLVARRGTGRTIASFSNSSSRSIASARLRSWVRKRWAWITITPSLVMRWPARRLSRAAASSGSATLRVSKRNWAAVASLLTFCPPGPEARTNVISMSSSWIERAWKRAAWRHRSANEIRCAG